MSTTKNLGGLSRKWIGKTPICKISKIKKLRKRFLWFLPEGCREGPSKNWNRRKKNNKRRQEGQRNQVSKVTPGVGPPKREGTPETLLSAPGELSTLPTFCVLGNERHLSLQQSRKRTLSFSIIDRRVSETEPPPTLKALAQTLPSRVLPFDQWRIKTFNSSRPTIFCFHTRTNPGPYLSEHIKQRTTVWVVSRTAEIQCTKQKNFTSHWDS